MKRTPPALMRLFVVLLLFAGALALVNAAGCGGDDASVSTGPNDAGDASFSDALADGSPSDADLDAGTDADAGHVIGSGGTRVCPAGGIDVADGAGISTAVNAAPANAILCIHGSHVASATLILKDGQQLIGIDSTARITGGQALSGWSSSGAGAWVYSGSLASTTTHLGPVDADGGLDLGGGYAPCYEVSTYEDDVFFDGQRMMRVLSADQLSGTTLPQGQRVTSGEFGRFFFDYTNHQIYIDHDPTGHVVELATLGDIVTSAAGAKNVVIDNLLLEMALENIVDAKGGRSWTIRDSTLRNAHLSGFANGIGVSGSPFLLVRDLITSNGRYAISSDGTFLTLQDSELSWNNIANYRGLIPATTTCTDYWGAGAGKAVLSSGGSPGNPSLQLIRVESDHNVGDGFWTDVRDQYVLVQGGRFHDNERYGYIHEIGCDIEITGAEFDHNGVLIKNPDIAGNGAGIVISDSNNGFVHDDLIHDNLGGGVLLMWHPHTGLTGNNSACLGADAGQDDDVSNALTNNVVEKNSTYLCTDAGLFGERGTETAAARRNTFAGNAYHVSDPAQLLWVDSTRENWTGWNNGGNDLDGSVVTGCTY